MMSRNVIDALWNVLSEQGSAWVVGGFLLALLLLRLSPALAGVRARSRGALLLTGLHLLLAAASAGALVLRNKSMASDLHLAAAIAGALSLVGSIGLIAFDVLLARLRANVPRILQDVIIGIAGLIAIVSTASHAGINLTQIVATSAVLTAVVGLALQDTLGNLVAGLALQLDRSVRVGDWVKVQEFAGRVSEIHWRYTAIETRNWETVIIPNSVLTKAHVTVLGRRTGEPQQWRRWVYFNVDFRFPPSQVIDLVTAAVRDQPIEFVAARPAPNCVLMDLHESYARYAVRYWLTDMAPDDPTDSIVRTRIFFTLQRAAIPLSIPAHAIFVTQDTLERRHEKQVEADSDRIEALAQVDLFRGLSHAERAELAGHLQQAPFTRGEVLTRQGKVAHHLYLIRKGCVSVRVADGSLQREVAQLRAGDFFGEMSLLTGEPRSATVVAAEDVECLRLDADAFRSLLQRRPDMAEQVAKVLAERRTGLVATREGLDEEKRKQLLATHESDLLGRIRGFFGLAQ